DGFVSKAEIAAALEQLQGIAYAECPPASIDVKVLERVSHAVALRCCALPLEIRGKELIVAMAEPQNLTFVNELRFRAGMEISRRFSFRHDVLLGIKKFYGDGDLDSVQESEPGDDVDLSQREPGVADVEFITADAREESNAAIKELNSSKQRLPQDGRFLMVYRGERFDLRISTLPTHFGEKIAIRVLDPGAAIITLDKLGLPDHLAKDIRRILSNPQGMLLVTGPTGSGKSTTLYDALNQLRSPGCNIIKVAVKEII